MASFERDALGEQRIEWLRGLPKAHTCGAIALVHASPGDPWKCPTSSATNDELESVYKSLGAAITVYAHIHCPYIRNVWGRLIINTGSVSLSYDGDRRASYLLLDGSTPSIRRVEYDVEREIGALATSSIPHAAWIAKTLQTASTHLNPVAGLVS